LGVRLLDNATNHGLVLGSFHAAPLTASNSLRRAQIHAAHAKLLAMGGEQMTLMVGDFNYPFFTRSLTAHMKNSGYELSLSDRRTYTRYKVFKGHFDFATSLGLEIGKVVTLPRGASDHLPILVTAEYGSGVAVPEVTGLSEDTRLSEDEATALEAAERESSEWPSSGIPEAWQAPQPSRSPKQ
jgi:hypothetical protein